MLEDLIQTLKTSLEDIGAIQEVHMYPLQESHKKYPAVVAFPVSVDNEFQTNAENFKVYNFSMFVTVNINNQTTKKVYEEILPRTFDSVVAHFDDKWNIGTVNGHRVWAKVSSNSFGISNEAKSKTAFIDMTLQIKANTTN